MRCYLSDRFVLKWLENPAVYDIKNDELYELDIEAFEFFLKCAEPAGCDDSMANDLFIEYCLSEGILTTEIVTAKQPLPVKSPAPSLRHLELQITNRCNIRCKHCYIGSPEYNELSIGDMKIILNEFEEMQGLRLLITGGEPLMHSDFTALNSLLPAYGFRKILFTNGLLINKGILKDLNVDEIQFSVDGMERGHDILRGKGTYRIVMQKIQDAVEAGFAVSIATMVHRENLNEFDEMDALFKKIGIRDWTVDVPCMFGSFENNQELQSPPEIAGKILLNYGFGGGLHSGGEGYACGFHLASVLANGDICKCTFYSDRPLGNIKDGLKKAWMRASPVRLEYLECFKISCRHIDECRGGCRFRAEITEGALNKDIYKCYGYGIIENKQGHEAPVIPKERGVLIWL
jgi:radical SAM protein with 4Fe4S-binding SPASM domain